MSGGSMTIHYSHWASQPYVAFRCMGTMVQWYVSVNTKGLPSGVYSSDGGLYTFDQSKATCTQCLK